MVRAGVQLGAKISANHCLFTTFLTLLELKKFKK